MAFENWHYFEANFDDLYKKYKDKYIAIKDQKVIAVFDDEDVCFQETKKKEKPGTFTVQWCNPKELIPIKVTRNIFGEKVNEN
ncbi:MAG: hypothetical protein Ta2D_01230 [Rickettsiales bacterium]|nr:MAG: hypothetical protein Ta2D_01230 [Rickettsiales bacterium]